MLGEGDCYLLTMNKLLSVLCVLLFSASVHAQSYTEMVRRGMDLLEKDSLLLAEDVFRQAMKTSPTNRSNGLLFRYIGQIQERTGRQKEALDSYTVGLNLAPTNAELMMDRATLNYRLGDYDRAVMDCTNALELNTQNVEALFLRAHIYSLQQAFKLGRQDYETLLKADPTNMDAQLGLILLNDKDNRPREAMEQINALVQLYPNRAVLYAVRGGMEHKRKLYELALHDLSQAIELEPRNPDYYVSRATLYLDMKKKKLARQDTQIAVSLGADAKEMASLLK